MPSFPGPANGKTFVASNASPIALKPGDSVYVFGQLAATATQLPVNDTNADFEAAAAPPAAAPLAGETPGRAGSRGAFRTQRRAWRRRTIGVPGRRPPRWRLLHHASQSRLYRL